MPLEIQLKRNGKPVKGIVWDYPTLSVIYTAAYIEGDPKAEYQEGKTFGDLEKGQWVDFSMAPIYYLNSECDLVKNGKQVFKKEHIFFSNDEHPTVHIKPGDVITAWRSHKS